MTRAVQSRQRPQRKKVTQESPKNPGKITGLRQKSCVKSQAKGVNKQAGGVRHSRGTGRVEAKNPGVKKQAEIGTQAGRKHRQQYNGLG